MGAEYISYLVTDDKQEVPVAAISAQVIIKITEIHKSIPFPLLWTSHKQYNIFSFFSNIKKNVCKFWEREPVNISNRIFFHQCSNHEEYGSYAFMIQPQLRQSTVKPYAHWQQLASDCHVIRAWIRIYMSSYRYINLR